MSDRLCAALAATEHQDPIATTAVTGQMLAIEIPTPFTDAETRKGDPSGSLTARLRAAQLAILDRRKIEGYVTPEEGGQLYYGIAPDPAWSDPARRRVIIYSRPPGPFATYDAVEYSLPWHSEAILALLHAYYDDPAGLTAFERFVVSREPGRDFYVCTHGAVDVCCAKFGIPAYNALRQQPGEHRTWRTTHFGGHRFAPTAKDFPSGYCWGFLDEASSFEISQRFGSTAALSRKLRGWAGVPLPVQPLDRQGLIDHGWAWASFPRTGEVVDQEMDGKRWRVRMEYTRPGGQRGSYEGEVAIVRELASTGCAADFGMYDQVSPEYALVSFRHREG